MMQELYTTYGIFFILLYVSLTVTLSAFLITLFHEGGHALAVVLLTKRSATIFLGSYGDRENSFRVPIGKSELWIRKNIWKWRGGLCVPSATNMSARTKILFILGGPLGSLLPGLAVLGLIICMRPEGLFAPFLYMMCFTSFLSFLYNIVPHSNGITGRTGGVTYNDGAQIRMLLAHKQLPQDYHDAMNHLNEKRYTEAATILDRLISQKTKRPEIYRAAVVANIYRKDYRRANELQKEQIARIGNLNTHDRINLALIKTFLGNYDEAINYYKHLLQNGGNNKYNLNNLGYTLTVVNRFDEALPYLDKAIAMDKSFAHAYCNRGYARIKTNKLAEGKSDIEYSLQLDPDNAYAHRNMGIYYYETGSHQEAMTYFERARELDTDTPLLERYLIDTHNRLNGY